LLTRFLCWFQAAPQGSRLHWQGPTQSMRSPHRWNWRSMRSMRQQTLETPEIRSMIYPPEYLRMMPK
jgi:hypothetical protein